MAAHGCGNCAVPAAASSAAAAAHHGERVLFDRGGGALSFFEALAGAHAHWRCALALRDLASQIRDGAATRSRRHTGGGFARARQRRGGGEAAELESCTRVVAAGAVLAPRLARAASACGVGARACGVGARGARVRRGRTPDLPAIVEGHLPSAGAGEGVSTIADPNRRARARASQGAFEGACSNVHPIASGALQQLIAHGWCTMAAVVHHAWEGPARPFASIFCARMHVHGRVGARVSRSRRRTSR